MAGVDTGSGGGREVNKEINMIPFIDLLMVTIAFLLITAVWASYSRIATNAQLPGPDDTKPPTIQGVPRDLHVYATADGFVLSWKQASTTLSEVRLPRQRRATPSYDDLGARIIEEHKRQGQHRDPSDRTLDRAILHTDNGETFRELVAIMDAIHAAKRELASEGERRQVPAFQLAFAVR